MSAETGVETNAINNLFQSLELASDEAMTFPEAHGYLCALAVQSASIDPAKTLAEIFGPSPDEVGLENQHKLQESTNDLHQTLRQQLMQGDTPDLPCDPESVTDPDHPPLMAWSIGFMQALFESPETWQGSDPAQTSELTLPILAVSNLLDDAEFTEMAEDPQLMQSFCDQIPDLLIDLFLLFNAPEDT